MTRKHLLGLWLAICLLWITASACNLSTNVPRQTPASTHVLETLPTGGINTHNLASPSVPMPKFTQTGLPIPSTSPSAAHSPAVPPSQVPTLHVSPSPSSTLTPLPSDTPTATPIPTWAVLRGKVLERSNCRYGPGAPYLYKYGLLPDTRMNVIGRNELGTWLLIQAAGGNNPCWIKASLMEIQGDVMAVQPTYTSLPQSPYYGPLTGVTASRQGSEVTISWNGLKLRPGDDSEQFPYLVEAWVCSQGGLVFTPVGSYATIVKLIDEAGCAEPSHGRVYGVEKHGYTRWVEIPWPP